MWAEWDRLVNEIRDQGTMPEYEQLYWWFFRLFEIGQRLRSAHAHAVHTRDEDFRMVATCIEDLFYALEKKDDELLRGAIESLEENMSAVGFPVGHNTEDDVPF